jgi:hypothetical protein
MDFDLHTQPTSDSRDIEFEFSDPSGKDLFYTNGEVFDEDDNLITPTENMKAYIEWVLWLMSLPDYHRDVFVTLDGKQYVGWFVASSYEDTAIWELRNYKEYRDGAFFDTPHNPELETKFKAEIETFIATYPHYKPELYRMFR